MPLPWSSIAKRTVVKGVGGWEVAVGVSVVLWSERGRGGGDGKRDIR